MLANFATVMKLPLDCNLCSRMWALLTTNQIICSKLSKWLKLVELSMVVVVVEGENYFFNLSFMKSKLKKPIANPFGSCGANICIKLLHYGDFPIYCSYQILGLTKELEDCRCIVDMKIACKTL